MTMTTTDSTQRCPNCAQVLEGGERFCPVCGAVLAQETEETQDMPAPPHSPRVPAPPQRVEAFSLTTQAAEAAPAEVPPVVPQLRPGVVVPPAPAPVTPSTSPQFLTGSRLSDLFLGFLGVFVFNIGLPSALRALVGNDALIPGGTSMLAVSIVGYFVTRARYPAFSRGWGIGLVVMLVIALLVVLAVVLLILGILAICAGTKR